MASPKTSYSRDSRRAAIRIELDDFEFAAKAMITDLRCFRCTSKSWGTASFDILVMRYTDCDQCCEEDQITKNWIPIQND
jgi:hypothetical protein